MKNKILFLGSKPVGYSCLEYLIHHSDSLNIEIAGVLSNNNSTFGNASIKDLCHINHLPFIDDLELILEMNDIDFLISVQYHKILKSNHISIAKKIAINLHMAPLPELRGCNQFSFGILNGLKEFGTTLHRLEEGIDTGAIIAEHRFPIPPDCSVKELYDITYNESIDLFKREIKNILSGRYTLIKQQDLIRSRGTKTYFRKDIDEIKIINLTKKPEEIIRQVRATAMPGFEPPYVIHNGQKIYMVPEKIYNTLKNNQ